MGKPHISLSLSFFLLHTLFINHSFLKDHCEILRKALTCLVELDDKTDATHMFGCFICYMCRLAWLFLDFFLVQIQQTKISLLLPEGHPHVSPADSGTCARFHILWLWKPVLEAEIYNHGFSPLQVAADLLWRQWYWSSPPLRFTLRDRAQVGLFLLWVLHFTFINLLIIILLHLLIHSHHKSMVTFNKSFC